MAIRKITEYPNPILRVKTKDGIDMERAKRIVRDLTDTMRAFPGCIGLAAPQIGVSERIAVVDVSDKEPGKGLLVLINPKIVEAKGEKVIREGCLSIQSLTANVKRSVSVTAEWLTLKGTVERHSADGIEAICIQHEIDHLNGTLFIDRLLCAQTDIFRRKKFLH